MAKDRWPPIASAYHRWLLAGLAVFFVAIRVYHGSTVCLDGDEIFSVGVAAHTWGQMMQDVGRDSIHPPLFYFLLKLWTGVGGDSLFWVRLLPTVFASLAIIPTVLLGRELQLRPAVINLTVALGALHPLILYYSQHSRMYTLLMLCALTSMYVFHAATRTGRFVVLTVVNIVAVYAHYYGWMVIGLEGLYLILWKREYLRQMIASSAVVLAAFTPWIWWAGKFIIAKGGLHSNLEWIQKPDAGALAWFFVDLAGFGDLPSIGKQAVAGLVLLVLAAGVMAWRDRAHLHAGHFVYVARFLLFFVLGSVTVAFVASWLAPNSVWGHRHMVYLAFPAVMLVAAAYYQLKSLPVRITGGVLMAVWAAMVIQHQVKGDDKKTPFDMLVVQMLAQEKNNPEKVTFYSIDKYLHYPVWFYLDTLKNGKITGIGAHIEEADRPSLAKQAARIEVITHYVPIEQVTGQHFWVGYSSAWNEPQKPQEIFARRGCITGGDITVKDRYHWSAIFPVWCR